MPIGILYWMLIILAVLFGGYWNFGRGEGANWGWFGMSLLHLVLFALIGWKLFGPVLQ
jgi:hypothetical protein